MRRLLRRTFTAIRSTELGRAAGYGDGEAWWNHMVEERIDGLELFGRHP